MAGETFLFCGAKGSGKSAWISRICQRQLKMGDSCWSHRDFQFADPRVNYFDRLTEIPDLHHCSVFIDEAQRDFDAREWERLPKSFRDMLSESRHAQMDIYAATLDPTFLDTRFRRSVDHYFEIKRICGTKIKRKGTEDIFPKHPWQWSHVREYDIRRADNITRNDSIFTWLTGWKNFGPKEFNFYKTLVRYEHKKREKKGWTEKEVTAWICNNCGKRSYIEPE